MNLLEGMKVFHFLHEGLILEKKPQIYKIMNVSSQALFVLLYHAMLSTFLLNWQYQADARLTKLIGMQNHRT